jgi:hypothetical protein
VPAFTKDAGGRPRWSTVTAPVTAATCFSRRHCLCVRVQYLWGGDCRSRLRHVFAGPAQEGDELTAEAVERARFGRNGIYEVTVRRADGGLIARWAVPDDRRGDPLLTPGRKRCRSTCSSVSPIDAYHWHEPVVSHPLRSCSRTGPASSRLARSQTSGVLAGIEPGQDSRHPRSLGTVRTMANQ